jgi:acid phosphatase type 7
MNRSFRLAVPAAVAALAIGALAATIGTTSATADVLSVTTTADAFIASDHPTTVENTTWVSMDASPRRDGYFRFTVTVPSGQQVSSAQFRCWAGSTNSAGASLWTTSSTWSESTLTWNNAPKPNFALPPSGSTGAVHASSYATANVTSAITGSGTYTLVARTTSKTQWSCASKENTGRRAAQLIVTTTGTTPPPPTTTPPPPPGSTLVNGIGDGGPDAAHWNSALASRVRADNPALFLWPGDVRMTGTVAEWQLYDANYGQLKNITLPTPGNHDWGSRTTGYNVEFAGDPYADTTTYCNGVTLPNGWGMFSINSYAISSCLPKLTAFLAIPGTRKIVVTHEPRWSGGSHGSSTAMAPVWDAMKGHAIALLSGHDHDSQVIELDGMVQLVNGCAGADYYSVSPIAGEVYYSTSAADCTFDRFLLSAGSVTIQAVHADGSIDFSRAYTVTG